MMFDQTTIQTDFNDIPGKTGASRSRSYTVVSLFAGCGGLDLGFLGGFTYKKKPVPQLPFKIVAAYDNNFPCAETYIINIGPHYENIDLARTRTTNMPHADVLIGGFPCQEFSICGPRNGVSAKRGKLYRALVNYATNHLPMVIVAENVSHITRLNSGRDLAKVLRDFKQAGYRMRVWHLYAPDHGVPQSRDRVFLIGVRSDLIGQPVQPIATFKGRHRSIEWAIGDLIKITDESIPNQSEYFQAARAKSGHGQGDEVSKRDSPGYTVRANAKSRVQFHYKLKRRLTIRECARLQTFPDDFIFPHRPTDSIMQIGNAVPPLLANIIAKAVLSFLTSLPNSATKRPKKDG